MPQLGPRPIYLALVAVIAFGAWSADPVRAQSSSSAQADAARPIVLPAQPLGEALNELARQLGLQLLVRRETVEGRMAPAVSGRLTAPEALERVLAGSGLAATIEGSTITLQDARAHKSSDAQATLPPVVVRGGRLNETATSPVDGYVAGRSGTGLRLDVPLQEQPVSVKVIPADAVADLGVHNPTEVADYVAGVARETTEYAPNGQSFFIRGFSTYGSATAMNGYRQDGFLGVTDTSFIERIEFLKGPASVLYGASSAISGIVNTVTKRPQPEAFVRGEAGAGSFGYARASVDANHALGSSDLLGRINFAAQRDDGFRDFPGSRANTLLALTPIVQARLSPSTKAELEVSVIRTHYGGRCMGVTADPVLLALPIKKEVICDQLAHASLDSTWGRAEVQHELTPDWSINVGGFWARSNSQRTEQYALNDPPVSADGRTLERYTQFVDTYSTNVTGRAELVGRVETGPLRHRVIGGVDFTRTSGYYAFFNAPATPMDIIDTRYDGQQLGPFVPSFPASFSRTIATAYYLQDYIELGQQWKILLGVRHDRVRSDAFDDSGQFSAPTQTESATSPRAGVAFQPVPATALYASWTRSFSPNGGLDRNGGLFAAERGTQIELGVKQELLAGRLNATAAVFRLERSNVLTADPNDPTGNFSIATGEQESRGLELELSGRILPAWEVLAAYTYLNAKVTEDNVIPVGDRLVGAARHSGSLWNKVGLAALSLPDWSVGLGIVASGDRETRLPNIPIKLGSYVRFDAAIYYRHGPWRAQINGKNLANRRIFDGQGYDLVPQSPRAVYATLGYDF